MDRRSPERDGQTLNGLLWYDVLASRVYYVLPWWISQGQQQRQQRTTPPWTTEGSTARSGSAVYSLIRNKKGGGILEKSLRAAFDVGEVCLLDKGLLSSSIVGKRERVSWFDERPTAHSDRIGSAAPTRT
jgi:hypothetical protein